MNDHCSSTLNQRDSDQWKKIKIEFKSKRLLQRLIKQGEKRWSIQYFDWPITSLLTWWRLVLASRNNVYFSVSVHLVWSVLAVVFLTLILPLKCLFIIIRPLSGRLRQLKNKGKVQLGNSKSGRGRLPLAYGIGRYESEVFITKCESQSVLRGFTKVVVTRAGCLREWSQGERASTKLKFIELYMGAPTCRREPNRNICHWVLLRKREFISRETQH